MESLILHGSEQFDPSNYPAVQPQRDSAELLIDTAILQADYVRQIEDQS